MNTSPGPPQPTEYNQSPPPKRNDVSGALVIGLLLIIAGGYFLLRQFLPAIDLGLLWPVVVIVLGFLLILLAFRRESNAG